MLFVWAQNSSLIIENFYKYGHFWKHSFYPTIYSLMDPMCTIIILGLSIFYAVQFYLEYMALSNRLSEKAHRILSIINCGLVIVYTPFMNYTFKIGIAPC